MDVVFNNSYFQFTGRVTLHGVMIHKISVHLLSPKWTALTKTLNSISMVFERGSQEADFSMM